MARVDTAFGDSAPDGDGPGGGGAATAFNDGAADGLDGADVAMDGEDGADVGGAVVPAVESAGVLVVAASVGAGRSPCGRV